LLFVCSLLIVSVTSQTVECALYTCEDCQKESNCIWCVYNKSSSCMLGSMLGPVQTNFPCDKYYWTQCKVASNTFGTQQTYWVIVAIIVFIFLLIVLLIVALVKRRKHKKQKKRRATMLKQKHVDDVAKHQRDLRNQTLRDCIDMVDYSKTLRLQKGGETQMDSKTTPLTLPTTPEDPPKENPTPTPTESDELPSSTDPESQLLMQDTNEVQVSLEN